MGKYLVILWLFSGNIPAQDCVDLWQFFNGFDWISVSTDQVHLGENYSTRIVYNNTNYYNVPIKVTKVCNPTTKK